MKFCTQCSHPNSGAAVFCENCGHRLPQEPAGTQGSLMGNQNVISGDVPSTINNTTYIHQNDSQTTVSCAVCGKLLSKGSGQVYLCGHCGSYVCADHIDPEQHKCVTCLEKAAQLRVQAETEQKLAPFRYQQLGNGKYVIVQLLDIYAMDVTVPDGVESIAAEAFAGIRVIRVSLPEGLIAIDAGAFRDCRMLKQINIPASVLYIGDEAFCNCEKLNITLPATADLGQNVLSGTMTEKIEKQRKEEALAAQQLRLQEEAQRKAREAEARKKAAEEARHKAEARRKAQEDEVWKKAEQDVWRKAEEARLRTEAAKYFDYKDNRLEKFHSNVSSYTVPSFITVIAPNAFAGCDTLRSLTLPNHLRCIDKGTFSGCTRLESITIPRSVTMIGEEAFDCCESLTSVSIPNNVWHIGNHAFRNCTNLRTVTLPDAMWEQNTCYHDQCTTSCLGSGVFQHCTSLNEVALPQNICAVPVSLFEGCSALRSIKIPDTVKVIHAQAFAGCAALTTVQLPTRLWKIHTGAFQNCTGLEDVCINTAKIADHAFLNCSRLTICACVPVLKFHKTSSKFIGGRKLVCTDKSGPLIPDSVTAVNKTRKCILPLSMLSGVGLGISVICSLLLGTIADWICGGVFASLCTWPLFMQIFSSRHDTYKIKLPLRILVIAPLLLNIILLFIFPETYRIASILPCVGLVALVILWILLFFCENATDSEFYFSDARESLCVFRLLLCLGISMTFLVISAAGITGVLNILLCMAGDAAITSLLWWILLRLSQNTNNWYHLRKRRAYTIFALIALSPIVLCAGLAAFFPAFVPVFLR